MWSVRIRSVSISAFTAARCRIVFPFAFVPEYFAPLFSSNWRQRRLLWTTASMSGVSPSLLICSMFAPYRSGILLQFRRSYLAASDKAVLLSHSHPPVGWRLDQADTEHGASTVGWRICRRLWNG